MESIHHLNSKYFSLGRRCIKFLDSAASGCYKQKALDIRGLPTLPKHIMLFRARGVEEVEVVESGEGESSSETDDDVNCEGDL